MPTLKSRFSHVISRGFSLLEIVVSLTLMGLIVGLVINIFPSSVVASRSADEQIVAENLAQSVLEESRAAAFSSLTPGTSTMPSPDPKYSVERVISVPPLTDGSRTLAVRVRVSWDSSKKRKELVRELWISSVKS